MDIDRYYRIRHYLRKLIKGTEWEGHVFAVGGCCRDEIMGRPVKDIDLAVDLPSGGIRFAQWLHSLKLTTRAPITFPAYGTAKIRLRRFYSEEIEIVQTRCEKYTGRTAGNPEVVFGPIEEDCVRRDLTINSLYYDISRRRMLDFTGRALSDIRNRVIRTPADPDMTFDDDPVRILRCIRFAASFGWKIRPGIIRAMRRHAPRLPEVKPERASQEIEKMLLTPDPSQAMELMRATGAMQYVMPELCHTFSLPDGLDGSPSVWSRTLDTLRATPPDLFIRMAALLKDVGKTRQNAVTENGQVLYPGHAEASERIARRIMARLKFTRKFSDDVAFLILHHEDIFSNINPDGGIDDPALRRVQYGLASELRFDRLLSLTDASDRAASASASAHSPLQTEGIRGSNARMLAEGSDMYSFHLPLSPKKIMKIKGLLQNPQAEEQTADCIDYLMDLSFRNPNRTKADYRQLLLSYTPKPKPQ